MRNGIRKIVGVGQDVVNNFLCIHDEKTEDLSAIRYEWEAKLQRIQALSLLYQKADQSAVNLKAEYFREVCDCFGDLRIEFRSEPNPLEQTNLPVKLSGLLRDDAFADWSSMTSPTWCGRLQTMPTSQQMDCKERLDPRKRLENHDPSKMQRC